MKISNILMEREVVGNELAQSIVDDLGAPVQVIDGLKAAFDVVAGSRDPVASGKQTLVLCRNKGSFLKPCPGTREYRCCGYEILHVASFCSMDCAYCILQAYFHPPVLQYFVNQHEMLRELEQAFSLDRVMRIGTGEFTDSLIWEKFSNLTPLLVQTFAGQKRAVLELKTKTVAIDALEGLPHNRKTILSWSLNTERIIRSEERFTATLSARLKAARRCIAWGYPVAFHFDPIVIYEGCEKEYRAVIQTLFDHIPAGDIVWISLGTFRFMPALKRIVQERFQQSKIVYGEFVPGLDGKMRYFKPLRMQIYQKIVSWIREIAPDLCVYFCMEDDDVWENCMGFKPENVGGLPHMLDVAAVEHCRLTPFVSHRLNR